MKRKKQISRRGRRGFTLTELTLASSISVVLMVGTVSMYIYVFKAWDNIDKRMQADQDLNSAITLMTYGTGGHHGIRSAKNVTLDTEDDGWTMSYITGGMTAQSNSITYSASDKILIFNPGEKVLGRNISDAQVSLRAHSAVITLQAEKTSKKGYLQVQRKIGTEIYWRN